MKKTNTDNIIYKVCLHKEIISNNLVSNIPMEISVLFLIQTDSFSVLSVCRNFHVNLCKPLFISKDCEKRKKWAPHLQ